MSNAPGLMDETRVLPSVEAVKVYFEARNHLRKGVCLLNAGQYQAATEQFTKAATANPDSRSLARLLVLSLSRAGRYQDAADVAGKQVVDEPNDLSDVIRLALLQWKNGNAEDGIQTLREAIADHPENAELHFQLGTLLASCEQEEEAELRFTQSVAIDSEHVDAMVSLAMCFAARSEVTESLHLLQRAQAARPHDARIALLLSMAAKAANQAGNGLSIRAEMPDEKAEIDDQAIDELSRIIEREPEFVEAFLSLEAQEVDEDVFDVLASTLNRAVERHPREANFHYLSGRVLFRLGRSEEAIAATEKAVDIDPRFVGALIQLARLYEQTNRCDAAATRLEQAITLGVEYADTYYMLGNLYRDTGKLERARWAYQNALKINGKYEAARKALESLAA